VRSWTWALTPVASARGGSSTPARGGGVPGAADGGVPDAGAHADGGDVHDSDAGLPDAGSGVSCPAYCAFHGDETGFGMEGAIEVAL
jgi:hypothetical protein